MIINFAVAESVNITSWSPHQTITQNPINFSRNVSDAWSNTQYEVIVRDFYNNPITNSRVNIGTNTSTNPTQLWLASSMNLGIYKRQVRALDNNGQYQTSPVFTFGIHNATAWQLAWFMEFESVFGNVIKHNGNIYTNTTQLQWAVFANMSSSININGDINPAINNVSVVMPFPYSLQAINLNPGDGTKSITAVISTGSLNPVSVTKQVILDTTPPISPTLTNPTNNTYPLTLSREGASDMGAGVMWYTIQIADNTQFWSIIHTGTTTSNNYTVQTNLWNASTYYRRVITNDRVWNQSTSEVKTLNMTSNEDITISLSPIQNAELNTLYQSAITTISWLSSQPSTIHITTGNLIINNSNVWLSWTINNGSQIQIELLSAPNYNSTTNTTVYINNQAAGSFSVTTKSPDTTGDNNDQWKPRVQIIFHSLMNTYGINDPQTINLMIELSKRIIILLNTHNLNTMQEETLEYLLSLIDEYLEETENDGSDLVKYITRNGRIFTITYDQTRVWYTSPNFRKIAFFASRNSMKQHIDIHNPGWLTTNIIGTIPTLPNTTRGNDIHVMPNGKIYKSEQKPNGKRHSPDMIDPKEFDTKNTLVNRLTQKNQTISHY